MRLIDADSIEYHHLIALEDTENSGKYSHKKCITEDEIKDIPTAEVDGWSIPLKWILDYITNKTRSGTKKRQYLVDMYVTWSKEQEE